MASPKSLGSEVTAWHGTPLALTLLPSPTNAQPPLRPEATTEIKKTKKYSDIIHGVDFTPYAIETSGAWGEQALELVNAIGRRIAAVSHEPLHCFSSAAPFRGSAAR